MHTLCHMQMQCTMLQIFNIFEVLLSLVKIWYSWFKCDRTGAYQISMHIGCIFFYAPVHIILSPLSASLNYYHHHPHDHHDDPGHDNLLLSCALIVLLRKSCHWCQPPPTVANSYHRHHHHHHHTTNSVQDDDDDDDFTMELSLRPCKGGGGESKSSHSRRQLQRHSCHKYITNAIQIQYKCFTNTELIQYKYDTCPQADGDTGSRLLMNSPLTHTLPDFPFPTHLSWPNQIKIQTKSKQTKSDSNPNDIWKTAVTKTRMRVCLGRRRHVWPDVESGAFIFGICNLCQKTDDKFGK